LKRIFEAAIRDREEGEGRRKKGMKERGRTSLCILLSDTREQNFVVAAWLMDAPGEMRNERDALVKKKVPEDFLPASKDLSRKHASNVQGSLEGNPFLKTQRDFIQNCNVV
jgi:hypothetical protein